MNIKRSVFVFVIMFVLSLSFVTAFSFNISEGSSDNSLDGLKEYKITYGKCVANLTKIKRSCYIDAREDYGLCKFNVRNDSDLNRTEIRSAARECRNQYKDSLKQCKANFKEAKILCKMYKCTEKEDFIDGDCVLKEEFKPKMTYGRCVSNLSRIKRECYKLARANYSLCKFNIRNNSELNNTEKIQALRVCRKGYSDEKDECKANFHEWKELCEMYKCKEDEVFIDGECVSREDSSDGSQIGSVAA